MIRLMPSTSREPKRSRMMPPGSCIEVYAQPNAEKAMPMVMASKPRSVRMLGAAIDSVARST
ncbi:hypothetical protein D3C73_1466460 [compost metagenome]